MKNTNSIVVVIALMISVYALVFNYIIREQAIKALNEQKRLYQQLQTIEVKINSLYRNQDAPLDGIGKD